MEAISVGHPQPLVQDFEEFASGKIQTCYNVPLNKEVFIYDHSLFDEAAYSLTVFALPILVQLILDTKLYPSGHLTYFYVFSTMCSLMHSLVLVGILIFVKFLSSREHRPCFFLIL